MEPILFVHNANNADIMPCVVACAVNPNDVMHGLHDTHALASQASLSIYDMPKFNCWQFMQACQPTSNKINHLTFSSPY